MDNYLIHQNCFGDNIDGRIEVVVLIGPPCIGKSTYKNSLLIKKEYVVINRDDIVDKFCGIYDLEYHEMFDKPPTNAKVGEYILGKEKYGVVIQAPEWMTWTNFVYTNLFEIGEKINKELEDSFVLAVNSKKNIIVDMTNMDVKSRRKIFYYISGKENEYFKKAVVFTLKSSNLEELTNRLNKRNEITRRKIDYIVLENMIKNFQTVTPEEGFDKADIFDNF